MVMLPLNLVTCAAIWSAFLLDFFEVFMSYSPTTIPASMLRPLTLSVRFLLLEADWKRDFLFERGWNSSDCPMDFFNAE
jgi:hypothetical protein